MAAYPAAQGDLCLLARELTKPKNLGTPPLGAPTTRLLQTLTERCKHRYLFECAYGIRIEADCPS
jgi:hypothetical protein